jgi:glycosyltransferase involved in cell wall biosynthesis
VELVSLDLGPRFQRPDVDGSHGWKLTLTRGIVSKHLRVSWAPGFARAVEDACNRVGDPVLHDNGVWLPCNHAVARLARRTGRPLLVSPRGMLLAWAKRSKASKKALAWSLYQHRDLESASVFHATSITEATAIRDLGLRQPIAVVPNAVQPPPLAPGRKPATSPRLVLFLSRLTRKKGLEGLLRVWATVRPQGWKLVVAGPDEGGYGAQLLMQWQPQKLGSEVEFLGPVWGGEKWRLFREASIFVLPSLSENFGIVVAEALASEVPVITTKATPWRAIEENRCGWWVDAGDEALAAALSDGMALSDAERAQMGERGRALVAREYAPDSVARRMMDVYAWQLKMGPRPACVVVD